MLCSCLPACLLAPMRVWLCPGGRAQVSKILANVAHKYKRTVLCTIHQPSSDIFHMFDDLIVLADGQLLYQGTAEHMVGW